MEDGTIAPPPAPKPRTSTTKVLLALTGLGTLALAGSLGAIWWVANRVDEGSVSEGSYLRVNLDGSLSDQPAQGGLFDDPSDAPPTVTEIADAIARAGADDRIDGLLLYVGTPSGGWASHQELRDAIDEFRAEGKPCVAYASSAFTNSTYYVASACDKIAMAPSGVMMVNGLSMEITYYKGMFEKLGVVSDFEHVGDFKSAIEVFERAGPSEQAAQASDALLDSTWNQLVSGIAEGRGMEFDAVAELISHPRLTPESAIERGLVDVVSWPDALVHLAPNASDEDWADQLEVPIEEVDHDQYTELDEYLKGIRAESQGAGDMIAVVQAQGQIVDGDGESGLFGDDGNLTDGEFAEWMEEVREDDRVKAVVVRVNSPGGSGLASSLMWREVARTKEAGKPVVVSMGDLAASGGYMMSCNADWIFAQPGTITGSIGVFGGKFALSGLWSQMGMTSHSFKRGELSDLFSGNASFSDEGRTVFKEYLASFYDVFVGQVSAGRGMDFDAVHKVAQGRVWTGEQALGHGLVDELGGLRAALGKAAELSEVDDYGVVRIPKAKSFYDLLLEDLQKDQASIELDLPIDVSALSDLAVLEQASGKALVLLPGTPHLE